MNKISNLSFSSWGEGESLEVSENLIIELMVPNIREISKSWIFRLFDDSCGFSCGVSCENSEITWFLDLLAEGCVSFTFCETHDIICCIEIISRNDDEFSLYFSFEREDGSTRSIFFPLCDVLDRFPMIIITEIFSEFLSFVFHNHENAFEILNDSFDIVFDNSFSTDLEKWFWSRIGEWSHTRTFSGREDDEVHG